MIIMGIIGLLIKDAVKAPAVAINKDAAITEPMANAAILRLAIHLSKK
jgi:hypothetical protein